MILIKMSFRCHQNGLLFANILFRSRKDSMIHHSEKSLLFIDKTAYATHTLVKHHFPKDSMIIFLIKMSFLYRPNGLYTNFLFRFRKDSLIHYSDKNVFSLLTTQPTLPTLSVNIKDSMVRHSDKMSLLYRDKTA